MLHLALCVVFGSARIRETILVSNVNKGNRKEHDGL